MKKKLTEIADIQLGYQFRKKIEPVDNGTHRVIQIRDFDEDHILNRENLSRVHIDKPAEKFLIRKGDLLFLSRGNRNWAAPIVNPIERTVAVSHFFVIRSKSQAVLPEYLAWYINQSSAQEYLHNIARRGTHMPLIPLSAFCGLPVALPNIETQRKIVELSKLSEREKRLLSYLQEKRSQLINAICLKATNKEK
ncbi:MAG: restriction endonuclease subunit S [Nitrospirae bacterium]|nr:MAG: restriction endonuclease subunit S [Nitrospirota bacterium]